MRLIIGRLGCLFAFGLVSSSATAQPLVVLDAGHGGQDSGAVGCGLQEKRVVLDVVERLERLIEAAGLRAGLTRSDDRFVELRARAEFANTRGAEVFLSVHANANDGAPASGTETWISPVAGAATRRFADLVQREMVDVWGLRDRGVREANFTVVTETAAPAALAELGFINRCDADADHLGDGGSRQDMAEALLVAIAEFLDVDPGDPPPPPPPTGRLIGVVFEDRGAGLEDTTRRIEAASVQVIGTNESMHSAPETGFWSFDMEPGVYTVEASRAGFETRRRTCDVLAGDDNWCSVGLTREDQPPPPADAARPPPPPRDASVPDDAAIVVDARPAEPRPDADPFGPDAGSRPDFGPTPDTAPANPASDAGPAFRDALPSVFDAGPFLEAGPNGVVRRKKKDAGGCAAAIGDAPVALWLLFLAGLALVPRRRGIAAAVLGLTTIVPISPADAAKPRFHIVDARAVYRGEAVAPIISPDGRHVLFTNHRRDAIWTIAIDPDAIDPDADVTPRALVTGRGVGRAPMWMSTSTGVAWRLPHQTATAEPLRARWLDGNDAPVPAADGGRPRIRVKGDEAALWRGGAWRPLGPAGERVVSAALAPDARHAVTWTATSGLWLHRLEVGDRVHLGRGGHPAFSPDGRRLVFERTLDDGGRFVAGELFVVDFVDRSHAQPVPAALTDTSDRIEMAPSLSADGHIAWREGNAIYIGRLTTGKGHMP